MNPSDLASENADLRRRLTEREAELAEALAQQTATAEVLGVINSSPGDLTPVFDAILEKAHTLCGAVDCTLFLRDGERLRAAAFRGGVPERMADILREGFIVADVPVSAPLMAGESFVHIPDLGLVDHPMARAGVELSGTRTLLSVPLRKGKALLGMIVGARKEVQPFTDKQIALLQNFAAQAVIAMENARLITETRDRARDLQEALEYQTATSDVLKVISRTEAKLVSALDTLVRTAARICAADQGALHQLRDGLHFVSSSFGTNPEYRDYVARNPIAPGRGTAIGRMALERQVIHIEDVLADPEYTGSEFQRLAGFRTVLAVPLFREDVVIGSILLTRSRVEPFTEKQIELVRTFADQAVIAIENTRLLTETREGLEQQTATAEVLQVINASPGDLAPVFDAIVEKARRLCDAAYGALRTFDGELFHLVAAHGSEPDQIERLQELGAIQVGGPGPFGRIARGERVVHIADMRETQAYRDFPMARERIDIRRIRTWLGVALCKDDAVLGVLMVHRQDVRPFSDREIRLIRNFADQAVIAIENARLITETREALEQQTATAEVLGVINASPGDLAPVFEAILGNAHTLCDAPLGSLILYDGSDLHAAATRGYPQEYAALVHQGCPASAVPAFRHLVSGETIIHVADAASAPMETPIARAAVEIAGVRTMLFVPLRKDSTLLGYISAQRQEVRPFTEKQIALLQNFAAQAVIAMENARLITETREALEQQTATAEVLGVVNSSPGDLKPVFNAMLERATALCEAAHGNLWTYDGERFHPIAVRGEPKFAEYWRKQSPFRSSKANPLSRLIDGEAIVHSLDAREEGVYLEIPEHRQVIDLGGIRTSLIVALRKDNALLGAMRIYRSEVRRFSDKQIALLQNFAAQAVIAIENARLITETREALEQQTATAEVLGVINSSPGDLDVVFKAIVEKATRLCDAHSGIFWVYGGEHFKAAAFNGVTESFANFLRQHSGVWTVGTLGAIERGEAFVHTIDLVELNRESTNPLARAVVDLEHARTGLLIPLLKDGALLGAIRILRREVRPFTDKQIALLQSFAAQAVIAMENARLITETREALEQQTATAEVLGVINSSPGNLKPVFDAILEKAHSLCGAEFGGLLTYDGNFLRLAAERNLPPAWADLVRGPWLPRHDHPVSRIIRGERLFQIDDMAEIARTSDDPMVRAAVELGGIRSLLLVPLRKDNAFLGYITAYRQEVRPFTYQQIALLQNFAAQAVIAMENARLLIETREALEQQTATAEVLQVINSSPGDLAPVFEVMLEKAHSLCGIASGALEIWDGTRLRAFATRGLPGRFEEIVRDGYEPGPHDPHWQLLGGAPFVHIQDQAAIDEPTHQKALELAGFRTFLAVALRKDDALLGRIVAARQEVRPFSEKEIALLQNFAAQAVIALENARLITETREALEQQTATAEVLGVINSSPSDLAPVFDAMLEKALRLCEAACGELWTYDGECARVSASRGAPLAFADFLAKAELRPGPETAPGRALQGEPFVHIADVAQEKSANPVRRAVVDLGGARTVLAVPLHKEGAPVGTFTIYRKEVRPFTDKQIALLQNFAAQAVIAMENARLITETREALEQQTATSEVLQVINASPGDLTAVFRAMLDRATRLCDAKFGTMSTYDGSKFKTAAWHNVPPALAEMFASADPNPGPHSPHARMLRGEDVVHVEDLAASDGYRIGEPRFQAFVDLGGTRSYIGVALRKDGVLLGHFGIYRQEVRPFTDKQIALLQNFAAQAVIAMENARLLGELRQRTDEVAELNRGLEARVAEQVEELGRVGRLKRFLAPQLAELIVSQGDEKILESHRREIVVVFCDLRGYTAFTETAEPEEVLDFLREYHGALGPLVAQFEGTLDQFSGDGIMVFFNDPVPIPDPAERAVKMAIAMREAAGALIASWRRRRGRVLGFGAGIAQGYATLGQIGFAERSGYTAIGTVCNLAARLCAEAKDGQILLAQSVAVAVEDTTPLEEVGELTLKGLAQPVVAYNVPAAGNQASFRVIEGGAPNA